LQQNRKSQLPKKGVTVGEYDWGKGFYVSNKITRISRRNDVNITDYINITHLKWAKDRAQMTGEGINSNLNAHGGFTPTAVASPECDNLRTGNRALSRSAQGRCGGPGTVPSVIFCLPLSYKKSNFYGVMESFMTGSLICKRSVLYRVGVFTMNARSTGNNSRHSQTLPSCTSQKY
jgi:hypothetical protein